MRQPPAGFTSPDLSAVADGNMKKRFKESGMVVSATANKSEPRG